MKNYPPHQVNVRTEKAEPEKYRTVEEVEADLRAGGYSDVNCPPELVVLE